MPESKDCRSNCWLTTLIIDKKITGVDRNKVILELEKNNIESRPIWKPMHLQPLYKGCKYVLSGTSDNAKYFFENGICLPSGSDLSKKDQEKVIGVFLDCFD